MSKQIDQNLLIKKALPIFWANGYKAVSYQELAEGMGISQSFLYNQWGKEQLLLDSIDSYLSGNIDPIFHAIEHSERGIEAIREVYHEVANSNFNDDPCTCMLMNIALELRHELPSLRPVYGQFLKNMRTSYRAALIRTHKNGGIKDVNKIPEYVEMLVGLMFGLNLLLHYKSSKELIVYIDSFFDLIE
jgi:TetR/AcrR family transcriptional repressor of nem operon